MPVFFPRKVLLVLFLHLITSSAKFEMAATFLSMNNRLCWSMTSLFLIFGVIIWPHTSEFTFLTYRALLLLGISYVSRFLRSISLGGGSSQVSDIMQASLILSGLPNCSLELRSCPIYHKNSESDWLSSSESSDDSSLPSLVSCFILRSIFSWPAIDTMSLLMTFVSYYVLIGIWSISPRIWPIFSTTVVKIMFLITL